MRRLLPCFFLLFAAACGETPRETATKTTNAPAAAPSSPTPRAAATPEIVTASAEAVEVRAGGDGEASVRLRITEGYHVNANPPSDKFYIGTQLNVAPQAGIEPGKPFYPKALNKKFAFAEKPLAVYEGEAVIRLPLRVASSATKGRQELPATVRVQPCNDQACLQPTEIKTTIPVNIN